ncbi:8762_t:CDS:1, partial [Scutellospora calospora]
ALSWLFNKAMLKGRLMRWVLALQSFDFRVQYKPGREHGNADRMSRLPGPPEDRTNSDEEFVDSIIMYVSPESVKSTDLEVVHNYLKTFSWPSDANNMDLKQLRRKVRKYCLIDDKLYERAAKGRPPRRVIFSDEEKIQILKANHEGLAKESRHRGINSVTRKILMNYVWATG